MTAYEIEQQYEVRDGIIQSPGKFEGEPRYAPHFWESYLDGCADEDDGETLTFRVTDDERLMFPELAHVQEVYASVDDNGFIYLSTDADGFQAGPPYDAATATGMYDRDC